MSKLKKIDEIFFIPRSPWKIQTKNDSHRKKSTQIIKHLATLNEKFIFISNSSARKSHAYRGTFSARKNI